MRKTIALVTCFALISICVPLTYAGPYNYHFRSINVPGEIISSLFVFSPVNTLGLRAFFEKKQESTQESTNDIFRATGEIPIHRIGEGD